MKEKKQSKNDCKIECIEKKQSKNDYKIQCIESSMAALEKIVIEIKKNVLRMRNTLDAHINRQYAEIKVLEDSWNENYDCIVDGTKKSWGDYSGIFYVNDEDEENVIINKAKKHFETFFEDNTYHRNKKLGLFLHSPKSGKRLIEEMKTEE